MHIRETYVNETEGYRHGQSPWMEAFTNDLGKLYRDLKSDYGNARNMYRDQKNALPLKVGWVFTGRARYEDTGEAYTRSVWVEVSETEPEKIKKIINVNSPWKATL